MSTSKIARCSLLLVGLLFAACASAPPDADPPTAAQGQAVSRIPCTATTDCGARGGACLASVCRAENECARDADCASGSTCAFDVNFGGLCQDSEEATAAPKPGTPCSSAGLCPNNLYCAADGVCRPKRRCKTNSDCPTGQICDPATAHCTKPTPTPPRCHRNADCPSGEVCDVTNGQCTHGPHCIPRPDGSCCDPASGTCMTCKTDHDCPSAFACRQPDPASPLHYCVPR